MDFTPDTIPAWTYQPPHRPADYPNQCYYRAPESWKHSIAPETTAQPSTRLTLFRFADQRDPGVSLSIEVPFAEVSADLDLPALTALRDAINDALHDIAVHEADRERRESLREIQEQLCDPDFDARLVTFVHPDVLYVEPGEMTAAALLHPDKLLISRRAEVPA